MLGNEIRSPCRPRGFAPLRGPARRRDAFRHAEDPRDGHVLRRPRRGRLPLARDRNRSEGQGVERGSERSHACVPGPPARPGGAECADRASRHDAPALHRRSRRAGRQDLRRVLRSRQETAGVDRPPAVAHEHRRDASDRRPERHRSDRPHGIRLVRPLARRQQARRLPLGGRKRVGHASRLRRRDGQGDRRRDPAGTGGHGRRKRRLDRGFQRPLVHALSPRGRAAEGGPRLPPASLFPRARPAGRRGPVRLRQGPAAHRRDLPAREQGRTPPPRPGPERRQRRLRALRPPGRRRELAKREHVRRRPHRRALRPGRLDLGDLEERRPAPARPEDPRRQPDAGRGARRAGPARRR